MIGVFGGTFDPVHYGHLRAALEVKERFGLAELRLIPCGQPPHRNPPVAPAPMRADMLKLAVENQAGLVVDTRELDRAGPSYMVDTLKSLHQDYPQHSLLLFIGTDAFNHLTRWHQWQQLFSYAHLVVMTRPGFIRQELAEFFHARLTDKLAGLVSTGSGKLFFQPITQLDISATAIRAMIAKKQDPGFLLPAAVIEYIRQHQLYEQH